MTAAPFAPVRVNVLLPGAGDLLEAVARMIREHTGADDVQLSYEAARGAIREGLDPRDPAEAVRWVAAARHGSSWRVGASDRLPYDAPALEHEDAAVTAIAALVDDLGAPAGTIRARR